MGGVLRVPTLCLLMLLVGTVVPLPASADDVDPRALAATREGAGALERGELEQAVIAFEAALERAAPDENQQRPARRNLALVLSRQAERVLVRKGGMEALDLLDRALELHPRRLRYEVLRGRALFYAGRMTAALRVAEEVTTRSPAYADAWVVLADVRERAGELPPALEALGHAQRLRPQDAALRQRIARVRHAAEAEARFLTHASGNFQVRYDPDTNPDTVRLALTLLEDAYVRVTADLGLTPETSARVVLYEGAEFQRVTGAYAWVGALYNNGTLRVPMRNLQRHRSTASRVLAHEFAHHVLRERIPALPIWWHEGIAQYVEDQDGASAARREAIARRLALQKRDSRLLRLDEMRNLKIASVANAGTVQLFYSQALSFVIWLVDAYGTGALPTFLTALGTGTDLDAASRNAFGADVAALWTRWEEGL